MFARAGESLPKCSRKWHCIVVMEFVFTGSNTAHAFSWLLPFFPAIAFLTEHKNECPSVTSAHVNFVFLSPFLYNSFFLISTQSCSIHSESPCITNSGFTACIRWFATTSGRYFVPRKKTPRVYGDLSVSLIQGVRTVTIQ